MTSFRPVASALALALALPAAAQDLSEEDVKRLALEAILENPEIVMQAVDILREREEAEAAAAAELAMAEQSELLYNDPLAPVLGNPEGDVTLVEFFDYNCPYCKRAAQTVEALIAADPNLRVVYREWPILGEGSVAASRASLAARAQGDDLYEAFHWALMNAPGRLDEAMVMRIARETGLDLDRLQEDMGSDAVDDHIDGSSTLTDALGINGTPAFVVDGTLVPGAVPIEDLIGLIASKREEG